MNRFSICWSSIAHEDVLFRIVTISCIWCIPLAALSEALLTWLVYLGSLRGVRQRQGGVGHW
jgi:hypothetical protein